MLENQTDISRLFGEVAQILSVREDVLLAFLFGSVARGRSTPSSDVDVAVLFRLRPGLDQVNDLQEMLSEALHREVDIVVLNDACPIIRMQVLRNGVLVVNRLPRAYHDFFVRTVKEYDDLKRIREGIEKNILRGRIYA